MVLASKTSFIGRTLIYGTMMTATLTRGYKIVVLHGKGNTGETYRNRLAPLINAPQFQQCEFVFPTAPYQMGDKVDQYEWWRLPPGERSFTATSYEGAEASIDMIEKLGDVDAIIGHSQGAILMSIVLARKALGLSSFQVKRAILSGAAWPKPYENSLMEKLISVPMGSLSTALPTLHVIGAADDVNPTEQAYVISRLLQGEVCMHPGGHVLPTDNEYIQKYASFLF
jgi:predicted esterase